MQAKFFILLLLFFTVSIFTKEISFNKAQIIAENWTEILENDFGDQVRVMDGHEIIRDGILVAYVFDFYPKGYVIISGHDYLPPIKMYSLKYNYKTSGEPLEHLVFANYKEIINKVESNEALPKSEEYRKNRLLIDSLINRGYREKSLSFAQAGDETMEVEPLLSTEWNQYGPYNNYCPEIDGVKAPTGCVATSFAQILNYYEYPARGVGNETYYDPDSQRTLTASFDKEYEWWNMRDKLNSTDEEQHAVATLMYDLGIALRSGYAVWGTSASSRFYYNFVDHFFYSNDFSEVHQLNYNWDQWFELTKNQADNGWPVEYTISSTDLGGHSAVIDGYRVSSGVKTVHLNLGWGGAFNGYYVMNNLRFSDTLIFDKGYSQRLLLNFYPYPEYRRPVGLPPQSITVEAFENRSVFMSEYIIQISWTESPSEDKRIDKYIIYQKNGGEVSEIARAEPESKTYEIRTKDFSGVSYSVGVIDKNGVISDIPVFVTPVLK